MATPDQFDPAIHATDSDGNPIVTKDGSFRFRRGMRAKITEAERAASRERAMVEAIKALQQEGVLFKWTARTVVRMIDEGRVPGVTLRY